jgi:hypothetical protein
MITGNLILERKRFLAEGAETTKKARFRLGKRA